MSNAYPVYGQPVYPQPVYSQPIYVQSPPLYAQLRLVYAQPAPVYVQPAPVYYQNYQRVPIYHGLPHGHRHHGGSYYVQVPRPGYGQGHTGLRFAPVYYQR